MRKYRNIKNAFEILDLDITNAQLELETLIKEYQNKNLLKRVELVEKIIKDLDISREVLKKEIEGIESVQ